MEEEEKAKLVRLFALLGARDPEAWAASQIREGIPQLARFLFLRQAWRQVVADGDTSWVPREVSAQASDEPGGELGPAPARILQAGARAEDIPTVVRNMQFRLLFHLCYLLDDPGKVEEEVSDIAWGLFVTDEDGEPLQPIGSVHESVLQTDPTGREMRPRNPA